MQNIKENFFLINERRLYNQVTEFNRKHNGIPLELDEDRIKGLGNSIVPQIAYEIFKAINLNKQQ